MIHFDKYALFDTNTPLNYGYSKFKEELDELIGTLSLQLKGNYSPLVDSVMLLPTYLACKYVYNSTFLVRSILDKVIIDPFDISYIGYAEKFEALADSFLDWFYRLELMN